MTIKISLKCSFRRISKLLKSLDVKTPTYSALCKARKRIPIFGISPGKEIGCKITIRNKEEIDPLLKKFFVAVSNKVSKKKITEDHFSFGIHEYIEIPGFDYQRDIGIMGFEITVVFKRKGKRISLRKIKQEKLPKKQHVTKEEIVDFLKQKFGLEVD